MTYLDYNASSPLRPAARQAIQPFLEEAFGNASSLHSKGRQARAAVEKVRTELLAHLGDPSGKLIFTSGGTEANNLALKGMTESFNTAGVHLILSSIEHHAVLHTAEVLAERGVKLTWIPVDRQGRVDLQALKDALTAQTKLISVMHANNEVGSVQPIGEIGKIAREAGVLFHTDAVQSFSKLDLDVNQVQADLVSLSGHKLGGIKGAGALYVRKGIQIRPQLHGGPHEQKLRAGTENVVGIVGMGQAVAVSFQERAEELERVGRLRDRLESGLKERSPDLEVNGDLKNRLPGTSNVSFFGCDGETLLMALDLAGICVSTGSACSSGSTEPSHVLVEMGLGSERIRGSIRFSLGWATTQDQIDSCLEKIPSIVEQIRKSRVRVKK